MATKEWLQRWEDRYRDEAYAFGLEPNVYLKEQLEKLPKRKILFGAEGEGRNAIYAAKLGWKVSAFDISPEAKKKALRLANANNVNIEYYVGELPNLNVFQEEQFDALALIYAHFPASIKSTYHKMLGKYVRKGGVVILEAFSKNHLKYREENPKIGGPRDLESLFSIEEIKADFPGYNIITLEEKEIELNEGLYHNGKGSVIRFVGEKQ